MKSVRSVIIGIFLMPVLVLFSAHSADETLWRIHEWGTFTSLQDENGDAIGGINTDDEPVPAFVHQLGQQLLLQPTEMPPSFFQGAPHCHPGVTMRMETPVIYFHPPRNTGITNVSVRVKFRGGWLSEFYPNALVSTPALSNRLFQFGPLDRNTESTLEWRDLQVGGHWPLTNTTAHVWTSPRAVKAALVRTPEGEAEQFLFYRGVAHIDAPLRVATDPASGTLAIRSQWQLNEKPPAIRSLMLVDIRADGEAAFRTLPDITLDPDVSKVLARTPASFSPGEFTSQNLVKLRELLKLALVSEGLHTDEALALLNTWELSYFKSPGLRLFFIVPREWTDFHLPLEVSVPAELTRVMVGRIELVKPEQRAALRAIAQMPPEKIQADSVKLRTDFYDALLVKADFNREWDKYVQGRRLDTIIAVPASYQTFLGLGRFRNALLLDEARRRPAAGLTGFIGAHGLHAYAPPKGFR
jgi:hypothetical protein